jgi:hypothetical protein
MGYGVIISPHEFKELFCRYYREQIVKNYQFAEVTNGMTTVPNFINFLSVILQL